jgi:hypothetical protein
MTPTQYVLTIISFAIEKFFLSTGGCTKVMFDHFDEVGYTFTTRDYPEDTEVKNEVACYRLRAMWRQNR